MFTPNATIVKELTSYCKDLSVKWNNVGDCWEIWIKMPHGNRLVTPVVKSIYDDGAGMEFCPLDRRILKWVYEADSKRKTRHTNWKWVGKNKHLDSIRKKKEAKIKQYKNAAKDSWSLVNNEFIGAEIKEESDYKAPDEQSLCRKRINYRSGENAKSHFGGNK